VYGGQGHRFYTVNPRARVACSWSEQIAAPVTTRRAGSAAARRPGGTQHQVNRGPVWHRVRSCDVMRPRGPGRIRRSGPRDTPESRLGCHRDERSVQSRNWLVFRSWMRETGRRRPPPSVRRPDVVATDVMAIQAGSPIDISWLALSRSVSSTPATTRFRLMTHRIDVTPPVAVSLNQIMTNILYGPSRVAESGMEVGNDERVAVPVNRFRFRFRFRQSWNQP
jgi:hypothetical protein